jgi:hypothetical protein
VFVRLSIYHVSYVRPILARNQKRDAVEDYFDDDADFDNPGGATSGGQLKASADPLEFICDMREYDVVSFFFTFTKYKQHYKDPIRQSVDTQHAFL